MNVLVNKKHNVLRTVDDFFVETTAVINATKKFTNVIKINSYKNYFNKLSLVIL